MNNQSEALRLAHLLELDKWPDAAAELRRQQARIAELEAAQIAYASEFEPDADGDPDVGNIHANIRALKAQLAATQAAADMGIPTSATATVSDEQIKSVFLANGFTLNEDLTDLKPYVYQAARALLVTSGQQGMDARTAYEAECFRWLRDEALKVWRAGPVVFMTDADGCPGDGGTWSGNILTGDKLESAIPVAAQAKKGCTA